MISAVDAAKQLRFQAFLLDDKGRLEAWRRGIADAVGPDDVVLDLGAGMGVLSFFALDAGARKVYAVEAAESAELARILVAANNLEDRMEVIEASSLDVELPEPASVLVTDTLETFGLNGQIVSNVIDARERLLTPTARLLPNTVELLVGLVDVPRDYGYFVDVWGADTIDIDLSAIRRFAASNMYPLHSKADQLLAGPEVVCAVDLAAVERPRVSGTTTLELESDGTVHGLGGFCAAHLGAGAVITNNPRRRTVSYAQSFLPLPEPLALAAGDRVQVEVDSYDGREWRWRVESGDVEMEQATFQGFPRRVRAGHP